MPIRTAFKTSRYLGRQIRASRFSSRDMSLPFRIVARRQLVPSVRGMAKIAPFHEDMETPLLPEYKTLMDDLRSASTTEAAIRALSRFEDAWLKRLFDDAFQRELNETVQREFNKAIQPMQDELRTKSNILISAYGTVPDAFYNCGAATLACADFLYEAGQGTQGDFIRMLQSLAGMQMLSFDEAAPPSPPGRGIPAYRLACGLISSRTRPQPLEQPRSLPAYATEQQNIEAILQQRAPEACAILPLLETIGGDSENEISFCHWLAIAETELTVANERGHLPAKLRSLRDLFEKVFGCTVTDALEVLGSAFVDDPKNVFLM